MQPRIQTQPAVRDVFERQQQLRIFFQQQALIRAAEDRRHFRFVAARRGDLHFDGEPHFAHGEVQKTAQLRGGVLDIERRRRRGWFAVLIWPVGAPVHRCRPVSVHCFFLPLFLNGLLVGIGRVRFR